MRGWPAWLGLWSAGVVGLVFALATPEALSLLPHAPREVDQVTATDGAIAAVPVLAGVLLPSVLGLVCWRRWPAATRGCLVLCAGGLGGAAVILGAIPDAGPWQPWVVGGAAAGALLGAVLGTGVRAEPSRLAGRSAGLGLVVVGGVAMVLGWRGLAYQGWSWSPGVTGPMWAALVGGIVLVVLGLVGGSLPDRRSVAAVLSVLLLAGALVALLRSGLWMLTVPLLDRHEESESGWSGLGELVVGVGLLAAATALTRRWWSTAALSVVAGCATAAAVVARDRDLWRLMW